MGRLAVSRWFLAACTIGFAAIGFVMAVTGDASARIAGICLLFFGIGTGAFVVGEFITEPPPPLKRGVVELPDRTAQPALILGYRSYPALVRIVMGLGFGAAGMVFAVGADTADVGVRILAAFGAALSLVAIAAGLRRGTAVNAIFLTSKGLLVGASWANRYVPWPAVRSVERRDLRGSPMLELAIAFPDAVVRTGRSMRVLDPVGTLFYSRNRMPISLRSLALPPDEIVALVRRFHDQGRPTRRDGAGDEGHDAVAPAWFERLAEEARISAEFQAR
jgi:hypothetical protein